MKLRFIFSEVGKGLSRNRVMSVAVILVTFVSLLFVGIAGLTQMQVSKMKSEWYDKIEVTIYICASLASVALQFGAASLIAHM